LYVEQKHVAGSGEGNKTLFIILKIFDSCQVHNMLVLMLDPRYKSLQVENYVGGGNVIRFACEYDIKKSFHFL
jgi:hypothetical protein